MEFSSCFFVDSSEICIASQATLLLQLLCTREFEYPDPTLKRAYVKMYCVKGLFFAKLKKFME